MEFLILLQLFTVLVVGQEKQDKQFEEEQISRKRLYEVETCQYQKQMDE